MGIGKGGLKPCALAGAAWPQEEEALIRGIEYPGKQDRSLGDDDLNVDQANGKARPKTGLSLQPLYYVDGAQGRT
jgi:hypothetical protein